jgi:hypothetical protein
MKQNITIWEFFSHQNLVNLVLHVMKKSFSQCQLFLAKTHYITPKERHTDLLLLSKN